MHRRAFTLVESVIALLIVAVMMVAALETVGMARATRFRVEQRARAQLLAQMLMDEILEKDYIDATSPTFGIESGEQSAGDRTSLDDVDDYHNFCDAPPVYSNGTALPGVDGMSRCVTVTWVRRANLSETAASDEGVKRIVVTVEDASSGLVLAEMTALRTTFGDREAQTEVLR